ncbi:MAG: hypothetical protein SFX19_09640 [Alphaproteobacteria bacterium]|nr:hypothetical protein [Alphaproteobacteria bacterium]
MKPIPSTSTVQRNLAARTPMFEIEHTGFHDADSGSAGDINSIKITKSQNDDKIVIRASAHHSAQDNFMSNMENRLQKVPGVSDIHPNVRGSGYPQEITFQVDRAGAVESVLKKMFNLKETAKLHSGFSIGLDELKSLTAER